MNKILPLLAFSILLLVPVGAQESFGTHLGSLPPGVCPNFDGTGTVACQTIELCIGTNSILVQGSFSTACGIDNVFVAVIPGTCAVLPLGGGGGINSVCQEGEFQQTPITTLSTQCQDGAILDIDTNHCVPDLNQICSTGTIVEPTQMLTCIAQAAGSMIGGALLEINSVSLLVGAIGTNPIITGLVGITLAGIAGQAVWFVHRRRKSENS